jgi:IS30 family transposase
MSHYHHLSIEEREKILVLRTEGKSLRKIAGELCRSPATISRELRRNKAKKHAYSAVYAHRTYQKRRKFCRRPKLLENLALYKKVQKLFLEKQWSPEQIANRLAYENSRFRISTNTIYRAIYAGMFDTDAQKRSAGNRGAVRKLRHRGKRRRKRHGMPETRGNLAITHRIHDRPMAAEDRTEIGHWETDTLLGTRDGVCLVTNVDRCSRYLIAGKVEKKNASFVAAKIMELFSELPSNYVKSFTPDRGSEFAAHGKVTQAFGAPFYFADPQSPWQRGTGENTNGLLREYLPKSFDMAGCTGHEIQGYIANLNQRPRKCLDWMTPHERFFRVALHLTF